MNTLLSLMEVKKKMGWLARTLSVISVLVRNNLVPFLKGVLGGALLGAVFVIGMLLLNPIVSVLVLVLLLGFAGGLIWILLTLLRILVTKVPSEENFYGLSTGHEDNNIGRQKVLADWLSDLLDEISDKEENRPLTSADLKSNRVPGGEASAIDLRVLTTNLILSHISSPQSSTPLFSGQRTCVSYSLATSWTIWKRTPQAKKT
ncbi:MAG: hypothetical protein JOZ19_15780 [Rubrobacter sp.]|nr:hypothetical protein [Rubrobacter sp.]